MALTLPVHSTLRSTPPFVISMSTWNGETQKHVFPGHEEREGQCIETKKRTSCTGLSWSLGFTKSVHPNFLAEKSVRLLVSLCQAKNYIPTTVIIYTLDVTAVLTFFIFCRVQVDADDP